MNTRTENAIQSDASTQLENQTSGAENDESAVNKPSARDAAMEAIAENRRKALAEEGVDLGGSDQDDEDEDDEDEDDEDEDQSTQLAAQLGQDERTTSFASESSMVRVKIDGVEQEITLAEAVRSYQKDATATKRLQEATRILALAEQQAIKLAQKEKEENNSNITDVNSRQQSTEGRRGKIKDAFSKLYEGDEDGAVEAMLQIVGETGAQATQAPSIDTAAIAAQVRQQLDVESAYSETRSDYPELFSTTERGVVLGKETYARMVEKESQGISRSQAMHESAEEVAALFGIRKTGRLQNDTPRTARDAKLERKASLDTLDSANVVAGSTQSPAETPNVSRVIADMAKSRLGQSMNAR